MLMAILSTDWSCLVSNTIINAAQVTKKVKNQDIDSFGSCRDTNKREFLISDTSALILIPRHTAHQAEADVLVITSSDISYCSAQIPSIVCGCTRCNSNAYIASHKKEMCKREHRGEEEKCERA